MELIRAYQTISHKMLRVVEGPRGQAEANGNGQHPETQVELDQDLLNTPNGMVC